MPRLDAVSFGDGLKFDVSDYIENRVRRQANEATARIVVPYWGAVWYERGTASAPYVTSWVVQNFSVAAVERALNRCQKK